MEDDDLFCTRCGKAAKGIQKETPKGESGHGSGNGQGEGGNVRMGYVPAGNGKGRSAGIDDPGKHRNTSGRPDASDPEDYDEYDEYEEEERGRRRMIMIISGLAIVLVLGVLVGLLVTTPGRKGADPSQQTASLTDDSGRPDESTDPKAENKAGKTDDTGKDQTVKEPSGEEAGTREENGPQNTAEKESWQTAPQPKEPESGEIEEIAAQKKAEDDTKETPERTEPAEVKTEENEEQAEGIESLETEDQENEETTAVDGSYILPDSNSRLYSREELERLDNYTLQMAINEIYARHGRKFKTDSIREYFEGKTWYKGTIDPNDFDGNEGNYFNEYEAANRELMARIRASREEKTSGSGGSDRKDKRE